MSREDRSQGVGSRLERHRDYLCLLARMRLGSNFQNKIDASDIVQHAMMEAYRHESQFRGSSDAEYLAWLRSILATSLALALRKLGGAKRDPRRELGQELDQSSRRLEAWLADSASSPSQHVASHERMLQLMQMLGDLPDDQREVLLLKHCQGLTVSEICTKLGKSPRAVAGLLHRGSKQLRHSFGLREI